jgi:CheY-like chemotaxis protein
VETNQPLILIVDDDEAIHELLGAYLCSNGFEVAHAIDGVEAVEEARRLLPNAIVMDFNLSGRNGCDATVLLKTTRRTASIPVVLLTSEGEECRELAARAGCDAFLSKPCPPARVRQVIVGLLLVIERAEPQPPARLLLVEDDLALRQTMHDALEDEGYQVTDAANGLEALARLHGRDGRPDLIVLDLMMPVMDGWQFRAAQRRDRELSKIPVVVITGTAGARPAAFDGAACLSKPLSAADLFATVQKALRTPRGRYAS